MGNFIQQLAEGVSLLASAKTWIEGDAIQQLQNTAKLEGMRRVVGMPDLHPGRGYPVGAAFFSCGRYYPALIGNDIGCGMALWQTSLERSKHSADKLEKKLGNIDGPLGEDWRELIAAEALAPSGYEASLGTIGGGNHFAEVQEIDRVLDAPALQRLGVDKRRLLLLVHSGSRGLGQEILRDHVVRFNHAGLVESSAESDAYLARHAQALAFAQLNRRLIALRMLERLRGEGQAVLDLNHNLLAPAEVAGEAGWLHRKGATPADAGVVVIPGSRGDYSFLVEPIADAASLYSLAHGAGRKWMRGDCKDRLSARYSLQQLSRTALGSHVVCKDRSLIFEEAPEAYKPIDTVIDSLLGAGVIRVLARLKPVLTYKTSGEAC
ncbi:RNA ligase RtcB family protein [Niveibacterium sp. 24ML]|uniref:RNA ligase RtcB family protein n=1 Tax=Niveibacterium sp. 24ML TaxID=2985512 RepID=UPI00226E7533|nr:RNA ligase RtcB family protein [Niveibacterium sp. 24ML]MCX9156301.1 RNA ligase RtcB family protein [Niveibacterium sp. 24ML]